jgi:cytochrome c553
MHSNAFKDPVYQALWALAEKANPDMHNHCGSCHTPIGISTGTVEFHPDDGLHGSFSAPDIAETGVSCDVCHTISGTNLLKTAVLEHGNSSYVLDPGDTKRATLDDANSPYHETANSEHHAKSDFCGNCHNIFHPGNNFPIERTYDEWKYSIYAQNDIQCQDCHMVPVEVANKVADSMIRPQDMGLEKLEGFVGLGGPWRKFRHKHGFVGGNAVLTSAMAAKDGDKHEDLGRDSNYQEAVKRLQSVASLKLDIKEMNGPMHQLKVRVTNERAGHNLPTSLTEVREVWLEVVISDEKGNELLRSGTLDAHNELPADTVVFNAHAVDENGQHTAFPWEIVRFTDVNTIPPKGWKYGKYYFNVPDDAKEIKVSAKLHYRSFSQHLADLLLGKDLIGIMPNAYTAEDAESFQWSRATLALIASGDEARGQELAKKLKCKKCHGDTGISEDDDTPSIAGQIRSYHFKQLLEYKTKTRKSRDMDHGRTASYPAAPVQIPACGTTAPGSSK